jgi:hypothetical protein
MSDLDDAVARAIGEDAVALRWFRDRTGSIVSWSDIQAHADQGASGVIDGERRELKASGQILAVVG